MLPPRITKQLAGCNATIGCADAGRRVIRIKCKKGLNPLTHYRRIYAPGATGFFTVNSAKRRNNRLWVENMDVLRTAFYDVKKKHPFRIEAALIMPDPLHCLWALAPGDANYSMRWGQIKGRFPCHIDTGESISKSRKKRRERGLRQRRFWTHLITDQDDFNRHVDYIHCQARLGLPSCRLAAFEFFQVCKNGCLFHDLGAFG